MIALSPVALFHTPHGGHLCQLRQVTVIAWPSTLPVVRHCVTRRGSCNVKRARNTCIRPTANARRKHVCKQHCGSFGPDTQGMRGEFSGLSDPLVARLVCQLACVDVEIQGRTSALDGLVSALAGLTALTRVRLTVLPTDWLSAAQPLVLPWALIEVSASGCSLRGGLSARGCLLAPSRPLASRLGGWLAGGLLACPPSSQRRSR